MSTTPQTIVPVARPAKASGGGLDRFVAKTFNFSAKGRVKIYTALWRVTKRGYDLKRAMERSYVRYERDKDARRTVWRDWVRGLQAGRPLHELMAPYVPEGERLLIAAGEEAGRIDQALERAMFVADANRRVSSTLIGELSYPVMLFLVFGILMAMVSVKLMPTMVMINPDIASWPLLSRALYYVATAVKGYGLIAIALAAVSFFAAMWSLPRWTAPIRRTLDQRIPPYNLYREISAASFLITVAAMVRNGIPFDRAIEKMRLSAGPWMSWHLDRMMRSLRAGKKAGEAVETGLIPRETLYALQDYEDAGALDEAIANVGEEIVEDTIERVKLAAGALRAIALLLVAGGLLWVNGGIGLLVMQMQDNTGIPVQ